MSEMMEKLLKQLYIVWITDAILSCRYMTSALGMAHKILDLCCPFKCIHTFDFILHIVYIHVQILYTVD